MPFVLILILFFVFNVGFWFQPERIIGWLRRTSPEVFYSADIQKSYVALTIDDGPDKDTSPVILDILQKYNARASFFLITDNIPGNEAIVTRMVREGHDLGNHMTANESSIRLPVEDFEEKLLQADKALSRFADVHWFRPGSGWYNDEMLAVIHKHGYRLALGSVYPYDPQIGSAWFSTHYILWKVKPGDIIVLHDYKARGKRTAKALETLLPELKLRGYEIVTLSELSRLAEESIP